MLHKSRISADVRIIGNPSLSIEKTNVIIDNEGLVDFNKLKNDVGLLCNGQPHRIYWRLTEMDYLPIACYIELKSALTMMHKPGKLNSLRKREIPLFTLYVIMDEPSFMLMEFSEDNMNKRENPSSSRIRKVCHNDEDNDDSDKNDYDVSSLLREHEISNDSINLTDLEILRCAMTCRDKIDDNRFVYDCLMTKTLMNFTRENELINRQFDVLMKEDLETICGSLLNENRWKGVIQRKKVCKLNKNSWLIEESLRARCNNESDEFKTGNDVNDSSGQEPKRSEGQIDEITNTWRDIKRALSLLCAKTFSSNPAMLEAPPGSREDLVEAARTPCTPTDLDTMLYGYTNSIYVLDHTPESLPDMDMLQLFASPAGRALVTGDNRSATRGGSTSTSLSRESSSRLKNPRRASSTVSLPTPPPRQRKSSAELYKEAVEILGLTCSLTDSCRCLDCQSNYFDCDDDCGDARSELAAGTPILLDHALSHPLTCSIQ